MSRMTWSRRMRTRSSSIWVFRMPVAQVPAEPHQVDAVLATHIAELLLARDDLGEAAILEFEGGMALERDRLGEIDQHAVAMDQLDAAAAHAALVMGENGEVEGDFPELAGRHIADRAQGLRHHTTQVFEASQPRPRA